MTNSISCTPGTSPLQDSLSLALIKLTEVSCSTSSSSIDALRDRSPSEPQEAQGLDYAAAWLCEASRTTETEMLLTPEQVVEAEFAEYLDYAPEASVPDVVVWWGVSDMV